MPTDHEPLRWLTISQLAEVTGRSRQTIRKRLAMAGLRPEREGSRAVWYDAPAAIEAILGDGLDPRAARARLDKARADMQEHQLSILRAQVAPVGEIARSWSEFVATSRKAILSIPARATASIPGFTEPMARKLGEMLDATLVELAADDAEPSR